MIRTLSTILCAVLCGAAQAATLGVTSLSATDTDAAVTVFYPSDAPARPVERGPFRFDAAVDGAVLPGNGRLVVLSHGSGGVPWTYTVLAQALVDAGYVVAVPFHRGDNALDPGSPGPDSWRQRPAEVSRAIDRVASDARFGPQLRLDRVGAYGMSAGGHTTLTLAGGRWSEANFRRHCEEHLDDDFPACVGLATRLTGGPLDGLKRWVARRVIDWRFRDESLLGHDDPRIAAAVAGVPFAADFDMASLATPRVPLALITAGRDLWLAPRFHSDRVMAACTPCEVIAAMPGAGHGALLAPPAPVKGYLAELLDDPPGFDRAVLTAIDARVVAFFDRHLAPLD